jgi:hypothetical protein
MHRVHHEQEMRSAEVSALTDVQPQALEALDRYLAAAGGSAFHLWRLLPDLFPDTCFQRIGATVGSRKKPGPNGEWEAIRVVPCWDFHMPPYGEIVFATDGSCYDAGSGTGPPKRISQLDDAASETISSALRTAAKNGWTSVRCQQALEWFLADAQQGAEAAKARPGRAGIARQPAEAGEGARVCITGTCARVGHLTDERRCESCGRMTQAATQSG